MCAIRKTIVPAFVALAIIAALVWHGQAAAQNDATTAAANPFAGKFVVVQLDRTLEDRPQYLTSVRVEDFKTESFLVGRGVALSPEWKGYDKQTVWISMRHIETIYEYTSLEEIKKWYESDDGNK